VIFYEKRAISMCINFHLRHGATYSGGRNVRQVGSDTRGVDDIKEGELVNERGELQEEREWLIIYSLTWELCVTRRVETYLANSTRGTGND
jgi:hypothetical protein